MVSATECEGVLCFLWSSYCNQIYFTYPKILHLLLRSRKHQFDAVQLVYFACSRIIIDCNDVGFRMTAAQFFNNTFPDYVVWQTGERLCADNVWCTAVDQLQHFSGKEPSFTGLVSKRNNFFLPSKPGVQYVMVDRSVYLILMHQRQACGTIPEL